jgi:hypothetical protein
LDGCETHTDQIGFAKTVTVEEANHRQLPGELVAGLCVSAQLGRRPDGRCPDPAYPRKNGRG